MSDELFPRSSSKTETVTPRRGLIALLDALGTRTAGIAEAISYVEALDTLRRDVEAGLRVFLRKHAQETLEFYKDLNIRFFGDSVALIYEIRGGQPLFLYTRYLYSILSYLYVSAMEAGILFRGAISIGDYIHQENVILGPAVADAASWYDRYDIIGTAATPWATQQIRDAYCEHSGHSRDPWDESFNMLLYDVPINDGSTERLFAVNWPVNIGWTSGVDPKKQDFLKDYYALIKRFPIPLGTQGKFSNTEAFVKEGVKKWAQ